MKLAVLALLAGSAVAFLPAPVGKTTPALHCDARLPDDEDDDEPPTISESPQEFLYRLQRAEKSNKAGGNDAVPPAVAGPMNGNGRGRKVSTFGGGAKKLQKKEGGTVFVCTSCGSEHHQWRGRCGTCKEWNTIEERRAPAAGGSKGRATGFGSLGRGEPAASAAWRKSGGSWLDGLGDYDGGGYGNGGPVSMTDVCRDLLRDDAGGDAGGASSLTWQARERRTTVPDDPELNAVLGGGLMPGSISLVGGDPGVGKSTLLLQMAGSVASVAARSPQYQGIGMGPPKPSPTTAPVPPPPTDQGNASQKRGGPVIYISGEENASQIAARALRLGIQDPELLLWCETDADVIAERVASSAYCGPQPPFSDDPTSNEDDFINRPPSLVIVDSIQTMLCDAAGASAAGGVTQVRECVGLFLRLAKSTGVPIILVGHVTKSGDVAGPRTVEHMVDCVLYLEGGTSLGVAGGGAGGSSGEGSGGGVSSLRVLRAAKNRFGSSEEVGVYETGREGRLVPVSDPSSFFLSTRLDNTDAEGCAISVVLEGIRSMTVEVQALVAHSVGAGSGQHIVDGISRSRLLLILAVLQKRYGISFSRRDVYVNVVGGMRLGSGAKGGGGSDLAVALAAVSSLVGVPVRSDTAFVGEVGLLGELRPVNSLDKRIGEARRMGFSRIVTPMSSSGTKKGKSAPAGRKEVSKGGIKQIMCDNVLDAINCGLVDELPTQHTRSGPKLKKPKYSSKRTSRRNDEAKSLSLESFDIILDDENDDMFE